jgi:hypothetical protein
MRWKPLGLWLILDHHREKEPNDLRLGARPLLARRLLNFTFMKKNLLPLCIAIALLAVFNVNRASAQIFANDDAGVYKGWNTGTNYGFGFQPWILYNTNGGTGFAGHFLGNNDPVGSTNGNFWGMYANNSSTSVSEAFRAFSNSLPVNATFKIKWHNKGIGNFNYNAGGFNLRNGNNTNLQTATTFIFDGSVFSFYYIGGNSDNFVVYDGNGVNTVPLGFSSGNNGLTVLVTLLPNSTYNLIVENGAGTSVLYTANGQPLAGSGTIDSVAQFVFDADGDQNFNGMEIFILAPQVANLTPTNGAVYVPAATPLSFAVTSSSSTIVSNNIQLILNGVVQTNLTDVGSGTSSNQLVLNTPLQDNQTFNGTIIATDQSGNSSTNTFTFNTWDTSPNNIYVESGDYNYGGGQWLNNFTTAQPNQNYGQFDLLGISNIDYLVFNPPTNNAYRAGDAPELEAATDVDHNNFAANGFTPYDLAFNDTGEWEDYTRVLSNNVTYAVYARMSGFNANPTMSFERMATPQVSSANQPGAVLGTFVAPQTGGTQVYTFVPLKDFFSNPVLVNFGGTNTFRTTDIGGSGAYNLGYLVFVAVTNNTTLRPYLSAGFPFSNVTGVSPQQQVSLTIANGQTSVNPSSIQLFLNASNITSAVTLSNNAAGTLLTYQPVFPNILPGGTNSLQVIFSDGSVSQTDSWQFVVQTLPVLPLAWAMPTNSSFISGFAEQIAKADDSSNSADFPPSVARAESQLAGTLIDPGSGAVIPNVALNGGLNNETNTINYAIDNRFNGLFTPTNPFPAIVPGTSNNVAMAAQMYVWLSAGIYTFGVYSDDGFQFTAGSTPANTNLILGIANVGRAPASTQFSFIAPTNGFYPMRLLYFKAQLGGGGVELYSVNSAGANVLLNDPNTPGSIKSYYLVSSMAPIITISPSGNNVILSWSAPSYSLESAPVLTGPYTTNSAATSPYPVPATGSQQYFRLVKTQ